MLMDHRLKALGYLREDGCSTTHSKQCLSRRNMRKYRHWRSFGQKTLAGTRQENKEVKKYLIEKHIPENLVTAVDFGVRRDVG